MKMLPTKSDLRVLEKVFEAEINGRLPYQSKSKKMVELESKGLVEPMTRTFGQDRFGTITASGWCLSDLGRFEYCDSCRDVDIEALEQQGGSK